MAKKNLNAAFGKAVRRIRLAQNMTQEQLAVCASVSRNHVSMVERGLISPTLSTMQSLATALNVSLVELIIQTLQNQ